MIGGDKVGLRTRQDSDVPVFQAELYNDVVTRARADVAPWRPLPAFVDEVVLGLLAEEWAP